MEKRKQSEYIDLFTNLKDYKNKKKHKKKGSYSSGKTKNQDDGTAVAFLTPTHYKQAYLKNPKLLHKLKSCIKLAFLLGFIYRTVYQP